jgi:RNA polymerase-binding transcription factor DksA
MPQAQMLETLRQSLETERDQLQQQLTDLGAIAYDENFADSGQVAAEQGENRAMVNQLTDALNEHLRALQKMDDGTYGTCEVCGKEISEPRLEAMPATRYCIDHASSRA